MKTCEVMGYDYEMPDEAEYSDAFEPTSRFYNDAWAVQARADSDDDNSRAEAHAYAEETRST